MLTLFIVDNLNLMLYAVRRFIMLLSLWTDVRVVQLRNLWNEGHSARQIAMLIGSGVSRNAVIGKAHRLGLSQRRSRSLRRPAKFVDRKGISTCQWPDGHPGEEEFKFCGEEVVLGKSYCGSHCGTAYVNFQDGEI